MVVELIDKLTEKIIRKEGTSLVGMYLYDTSSLELGNIWIDGVKISNDSGRKNDCSVIINSSKGKYEVYPPFTEQFWFYK